jgi:predicted deacylase
MKRWVRPSKVASELRLDDLEPGFVHRIEVDLVHDALGRPMRLPVLVARGVRPGPVLGLTAALHGNELNGISVVHQLFENLDPRRLRGTVVAVAVVNVPGFLSQQREFNDGTDLNHIMPGAPNGNAPGVYAHRVLDRIVRHVTLLIDLHTASAGRVNSLYVRADMTQLDTARMAYLQRPQIIVHNPASDRTLRGAAMERGIPAITVEIGNPQRFQRTFIRSAVSGIRAVMAERGMVKRRPLAPRPEPVLCSHSYWVYTDHGGVLDVLPEVTTRVERGEVVARLVDIFGDLTHEYRVQEPGIVVGKSVNPVASTGARVLHLGIVAPEPNDRFVQRLPAPG